MFIHGRATAIGVGRDGQQKITVTGSLLYVRKCMRPEPQYIVLADQTKDRTNWCEVLACGPKVGDEIQIGDFVSLPEVSPENKLWRLGRDMVPDGSEIIVESSEAECLMSKEEYEQCQTKTPQSTPNG